MPLREIQDDSQVNWAENIVLDTKDNRKFEVNRDAIMRSELVRNLLADTDPGQKCIMPLPEIDTETLHCIWQYVEWFRDRNPTKLEKPLKDALPSLVSDWEWRYVTQTLLEGGDEKKHEKLFITLKGANFMNIEPLRDLCCAAIANMLRGKTEDGFYELFGIARRFTEEEEEKLYQEYEWLRGTMD
eukprot:TRINITY_DN1773_c0_g1_i1.p1 TRINITY_DN1773_c0_g1~~TRINITY_DN1773_c0_g1_i1.p1  ORF type:complete len:186 (+),score=60.90 TRINITY_DN1773_c0_g1_i1:81-638(+)